MSDDSDLLAERRTLFAAPKDADPVTSMMHLDLKTSLPESLLMLTDSMTMAASLEARVPLLDHQLVELMARVPASLKIRGLRLRYLQKRSIEATPAVVGLRQTEVGIRLPDGAMVPPRIARPAARHAHT